LKNENKLLNFLPQASLDCRCIF